MKNTGNLKVITPSDREIAMTRVFEAQRSLIFEAYTKPELLKRWLLGPPGWSLPVCEIELKVGGTSRFVWRGPDGTEMGMRGVYREIVPPERIVHTELFDEDWTGGETLVTTVLHEQAGRTTLTTAVHYASREVRDGALNSGMKQGVAASYDRLAELLASTLTRGDSQGEDELTTTVEAAPTSDRELVLTRIIDAPREKVFKAWTDPELLKQWFAPLPFTTPVAELDVRPGGANLIVMRDPEGNDFPNRGVYLEVVENERLVFTDAYTKAWEPSQKPFMTVILTFEDEGGKTRYTARACHWTVADRETHEKMGFHEGWGQCADQLEALVAKL
jgi:uncharacterized protein YndB with AHSA1/START domain